MKIENIKELIYEKDYRNAEEIISCSEFNPSEKYYLWGYFFWMQDNIPLAILNYKKSIKADPYHLSSIVDLSSVLINCGLKAEAITLLNTSLKNFISKENVNQYTQILIDKINHINTNYRTIAIHQPNFLPYFGYFQKIFLSDVFIFHDNVEFSKASMTRRTFIRDHKGEQRYITIPLKKCKDNTLIKDLIIDNSLRWEEKSLNVIKNDYLKTPFFEEFFPLIRDLFYKSNEFEKFAEYSIYATRTIIEILGLNPEIFISSKLPVRGVKSEYNIRLVKYCNGNIYNSGVGAMKYQSELEFKKNGIILNYLDTNDYFEERKDKFPAGFQSGISIIDTLFHFGIDFIRDVFFSYTDVIKSGRLIKHIKHG